jgi:hypothetical protein
MAEDKKVKAYEVLFRWAKKKGPEENLVGPIVVQAKTERIALVKAAIQEATKLSKADLLSLNVDVRTF